MKILPRLILIASFLTGVNAWAIDTYDSTSNQLTIPTVQVGSTTYTNVVISVGNVLSIGNSPANGYADVYNSTNGQLMIPSVLVGSTTYNNVIITIGSVLSVGGSFSNQSILSENTSAVTTSVQDYPQIYPQYGYGVGEPSFIEFGNFGSKNANCFVDAEILRDGSISSSTLPDAPLYVLCQQPNGSFKEVSQQFFGRQLYINGGYPLVADFNNDGIDDIFKIETWDNSESSNTAYSMVSNINGTYSVINIPITSNQYSFNLDDQNTAIDLNHDGCLDAVNAMGISFIGDCKGGFTNQQLNNDLWQTTYNLGTGICSGDFNGSGIQQLLITDGHTNILPNQPNSIFEVGDNGHLIANHLLPVPYWNVFYNANNAAHNFSCRVADINNDGKQDILIFTRPWAEFTSNIWTDQSYIQVYLNLGNWNFQDISATAFPNYNINTSGSYTSRIVDVNDDGYLDVALVGPTWQGISNNGNQIWINNKDNTFRPVFTNELTSLYSNYQQQFGTGNGGYTSNAKNINSMLPIQVNGKWNYIMQMADLNGNYHIGVANTQYTFK